MTKHALSSLLCFAAILLALSALVTLIPHTSSMVSDLGYHTLCPFAPWSTLTLLFLAWLAWVMRQHVNSQPSA